MHTNRLSSEFLNIVLVHLFSEIILHYFESLAFCIFVAYSHVLLITLILRILSAP